LSRTELILVGNDRGARASIEARARDLGVTEAVRFESAADDMSVVNLLRRASVFAYPSLYEGFGLPVLEAMACGTPVIASRAASIPEVVGDAGVLVEPLDVKAWIEALAAVLMSSERSGALRSSSLARAALFPWTRTAAGTYDVYVSAARRRT
jgi:glycosyltransferase involved in cell wall biosynthesis